jgi:hypothetical protein
MKQRSPVFSLMFCLLPFFAAGQDVTGEQKITIPSTPAFSILSFEPAAVMKPTSNKDFAADVLSAFDKDGKLLMNLGLEVSPYWLKSRPALTQQEYLDPDPGQAFLQSLSLSAATVKDSASGDNKLGAGFRFKLINGRPVDSLAIAQQKLTAYNQLQSLITTAKSLAGKQIKTRQKAIGWVTENAQQQTVDASLVQQFTTEADAIIANYSDGAGSIREFLDTVKTRLMNRNTTLKAEVSRLLYQRKGFVLEFAGASGFNTSHGHAWEKLGIWSTASYFVSRTDLFSATVRFMSRNSDTLLYNFDIGFAYLKEGSRYNLSAEGVLRWHWSEMPFMLGPERLYRKESGFTYRLAAQASYKLVNDISVNFSLGKDFGNERLESSGFFSILGFNYSLFAKRSIE